MKPPRERFFLLWRLFNFWITRKISNNFQLCPASLPASIGGMFENQKMSGVRPLTAK
jgi:hypothetical protein